jgi:hypothetical protein
VKSGKKSQESFKAKVMFEDVAPDFKVQIKRCFSMRKEVYEFICLALSYLRLELYPNLFSLSLIL